MEGRPWLRILMICIGFSLLGLPVWSLTQSRQPALPTKEKATTVVDTLHVTVSFAQPPASFELEYLGTKLCEGASPQRTFTCDWKVSVPKEGVDLLLKASWPAETPKTAVRVEVTKQGGSLADATFWTEGELVETVTVPGKTP